MADPIPPDGVDVTRPSMARVYDYAIGGTTNYAVDRKHVVDFYETYPEVRDLARHNRSFLIRAVRFLAGEAGIRQFLDLGSGLPTMQNVHQIAQHIDPASRVVYVDIDPSVVTHGRALLEDEAAEHSVYVGSPLQHVDFVLGEARRHLDFTQPVGLIASGVLHYVPDADDPAGCMAQYVRELVPGSWVTVSHVTGDDVAPRLQEDAADLWRGNQVQRTAGQVAAMFAGADLVEPDLVDVELWRPDPAAPETIGPLRVYGGAGVTR